MGLLINLSCFLLVAIFSSSASAFSSNRISHHPFHSGNRIMQLIIQDFNIQHLNLKKLLDWCLKGLFGISALFLLYRSHKFSLTTASEFKWHGTVYGNRSLTVTTLRQTTLQLENAVPSPLLHPNWTIHRSNWTKAVNMCSTAKDFSLASGILEAALKPVVFNAIWNESLGYADSVLRELQSDPDSQLTNGQVRLFRQRMAELYDYIRHHPALHQRHLWVGKTKPSIDPDLFDYEVEENPHRRRDWSDHEEGKYVQKRNRARMFPSEEICKTDRKWEQINITQDFYDNEVEVVQDDVQQYVFSYHCKGERRPCLGINDNYHSECVERYGWMYMYYRRTDDPEQVAQWGYVAAPHHCACKITPKFIPEL